MNRDALRFWARIAAAGVLASLLATTSHAAPITYTSRGTFDSQATIAYNSNFDDFGAGFGFPGGSFTRGDVTYHSTENLTWGSSTGYTTTRPLIGNNYWTPIDATIAPGPQYDMFGFDIGTYNSSPITILLETNLGTHSFGGLTIANSAAGQLEFRGYRLGAGEYFTGFMVIADNGPGNLPGVTGVAVGHFSGAQHVPEPAALPLAGVGLAALVARLRRRSA